MKSLSSKVFLECGLRPEIIGLHRANITSFLAKSVDRFFPISDTCRLDNGGILPLPSDPGPQSDQLGLVAFVPAAGASTRYVAPLSALVNALESNSYQECSIALDKLRNSGLVSSPLPQSVRELFVAQERGHIEKVSLRGSRILQEIAAPKALYPAVHSGETFLELKRYEHLAIHDFCGEAFVTPPGQTLRFKAISDRVRSPIPTLFYEQGPELSTVRFNRDGDYVTEDGDRPSLVPNGHGALLGLFSKVSRDFDGADGIFIRNIDNVSGTSEQVRVATARFLNAFRKSLSIMKNIRRDMKAGDKESAESSAQDLLAFWGLKLDASRPALELLIETLFHTSAGVGGGLLELLDRPFVLMGQVPNTGRDVGGTCVFATVDGIEQKICLELPHASPADRSLYLEDPRKATHFNPVFVAAELPSDEMIMRMENNPFWLISKKTWKGQDVYYQESILYELLGSSQFVNVIFVEIPRFLFNPHKTLQDAANKQFSDWISS